MIFNNMIQRAIRRGLNEAFLNLSIDDIEDIEDDSTYILKKSINTLDETAYFNNKELKDIIINSSISKVSLQKILDLIEKGARYIAKDKEDLKLSILNARAISYDTNNKIMDLRWIDVSHITDMSNLFKRIFFDIYLDIHIIDISGWNTSSVTNMTGMFDSQDKYTKLTLIIGIDNIDTSNVTSMTFMFRGCKYLNFPKKLNWDTHSLILISGIFSECEKIKTIDLSSWDTSNITSMSAIFNDCKKLLSLDLRAWNFVNVDNCSWMFCNCKMLSDLQLPKFDISNINTFMMFDNTNIKFPA